MKDPIRLLDASASEIELRLLRAGAAEQPPAAAMQRLLKQLGPRELAEATVSGLQPAAASKLSSLVIGAAAVGITLAGAVWMVARPTPPTAASAPQQSQAAPSVNEAPAPPTTSAETTPSLALEIARIDTIHRALSADRTKSAIALVQEYQRDFPQGVLRQEAEVLSIEAQRRAGDRRRARVLATRFLTEHPDSPHSARVRDLLDALGADAR